MSSSRPRNAVTRNAGATTTRRATELPGPQITPSDARDIASSAACSFEAVANGSNGSAAETASDSAATPGMSTHAVAESHESQASIAPQTKSAGSARKRSVKKTDPRKEARPKAKSDGRESDGRESDGRESDGREDDIEGFSLSDTTSENAREDDDTREDEVRDVRDSGARLGADEFDRLFREWKKTGDAQLRERLILMNRNLVSFIARKFTDRGEMSEDIIQQGLIGLINAMDHFDPNRGVRFATFATPTIMGEIRRYFRDKTWGIRVPRRLQELNQTINHRIETLTQELDRSPTYAEIARALGLQTEEVVEALEMIHAMDPVSIDEEFAWSGEQALASVGDRLGAQDSDLESWGDHAVLQSALEKLPEKERRVLQMAYFEEWSQAEIARHMQVSQMFISRLQRRALANLRDLMNSE